MDMRLKQVSADKRQRSTMIRRVVALLMVASLASACGASGPKNDGGAVDVSVATAPPPASSAPPTPKPAPADPAPPSVRITNPSTLMLQMLDDSTAKAEQRRAAALSLIRQNPPAVAQALADRIESPADPTRTTILAEAIALAENPPAELAKPLRGHLGTSDSGLAQALPKALAQYDDAATVQAVAKLALDGDRPTSHRVQAIAALGHYRNISTIDALVRLAAENQPTTIRSAAETALYKSTGVVASTPGSIDWQQWWAARKNQPAEKLYTELLRNLTQQNEQLSRQGELLVERLRTNCNRLYIQTPEGQRDALLVQWLDDPLSEIRLLALQIVERNMLSAQSVEATVVTAISQRLSDDDVLVRRRAATLLADLAEPETADIASARLHEETDPQTQETLLALLARLPRAEAVPAALEGLSQPAILSAAAKFIGEAARAGILSPAQRAQAASIARRHVRDGDPPQPAMVILLGRLGQPTDAPTLEALLDHQNVTLRRAAADALTAGDFPIGPLLARMNDAQLTDKAIEAAARRGDRVETAVKLLHYGTEQKEIPQAVRAAVVEIARRLKAPSLMELDNILRQMPDHRAVRLEVLRVATAPLLNGEFQTYARQPARLVLAHRLAEYYLTDDQPLAARPLLDLLVNSAYLPAERRDAVELQRLTCYLATAPVEQAIHVAQQWHDRNGSACIAAANALLDAADMAMKQDPPGPAAELIDAAFEFAELAEDEVGEATIVDRITEMRRRLLSTASGAPTPTGGS
jgi:hypothetical protein